MSEREVEACGDCPMCAALSIGAHYCSDDDDWRGVNPNRAPPRWCPLRQGPITIRLARGDKTP